jgi:hypothetical protein
MPGSAVTLWAPPQNVRGERVNLVSHRAKTVARSLQSGCGDIEDRHVTEAPIDNLPGQRDAPPRRGHYRPAAPAVGAAAGSAAPKIRW